MTGGDCTVPEGLRSSSSSEENPGGYRTVPLGVVPLGVLSDDAGAVADFDFLSDDFSVLVTTRNKEETVCDSQ